MRNRYFEVVGKNANKRNVVVFRALRERKAKGFKSHNDLTLFGIHSVKINEVVTTMKRQIGVVMEATHA